MSLTITGQLLGGDALKARWQSALTNRSAAFQPVMDEWAAEVKDEFDGLPYPPQRPNQKYMRTFALQKGYFRRGSRSKNYARIVLGNNAPRRRYAIGRESQATIHKGRWYVFQDVIDEHRPDLHRRLLEAMKAAL